MYNGNTSINSNVKSMKRKRTVAFYCNFLIRTTTLPKNDQSNDYHQKAGEVPKTHLTNCSVPLANSDSPPLMVLVAVFVNKHVLSAALETDVEQVGSGQEWAVKRQLFFLPKRKTKKKELTANI